MRSYSRNGSTIHFDPLFNNPDDRASVGARVGIFSSDRSAAPLLERVVVNSFSREIGGTHSYHGPKAWTESVPTAPQAMNR